MKLYKVTDENGAAYHGGSGRWTKNRWRSVKGELIACENGLHLCRRQDVLTWLGPKIWEAEYESELIEQADKVVVRRARIVRRLDTWNERTARLFAADSAESALQYASDDIRPTLEAVIYTVRCYADGQATDAELWAARVAARVAALSAARSARWSAESAARSASAASAAWSAWSAALSAAASAARSAGWSAAASAARPAGWSAARSALTDRLFDYLEGRAE